MPSTPQKIDAVLIDFFGTIADGDRHQVESTCAQLVKDFSLPFTAQEFAQRWGHYFFEVVDASNGEAFQTLFDCECVSLRRFMSETLSLEVDPQPYIERIRSYWRRPPLHGEAKEALARLPVPVCCVSNVDEHDLQLAVRSHGLTFDATVSSEAARSYKPDAQIFLQACRTLDVQPQHCIHVGDSLHSDIGGAQALGIHAVWIKRDGRIGDIGSAAPDRTIRSLLELSTLF